MKRLYLTIGITITMQVLNAQVTLLQASHEPAPGVVSSEYYDTVTVVPKNAGTGIMWDFSNLVKMNAVNSVTYAAASSVPSASLFPAATLVLMIASDYFIYYKSSSGPDKLETIGVYDDNNAMKSTYSNPFTAFSWPLSYNSSYTDTYSATVAGGLVTGNSYGSYSLSVIGEGSVHLPGGQMLGNMLLLKSIHINTYNQTSAFPFTAIDTITTYDYYHSSQRYPVVTVVYTKYLGIVNRTITINELLVVGITDHNLDADFSIFPNPAQTNFHVNFKNLKEENCQLEISNISGQVVKNIDLGSQSNIATEVDITALESGVYFVKTTLGSVQTTRKLIVQ